LGHILFINNNYLPTPSANALCVSLLAEELVKRNHKVTCISTKYEGLKNKEIINNIDIYRIYEPFYSKMIKDYGSSRNIWRKFIFNVTSISRRIAQFFIIPLYPDINPIRSNKIFKLADRIHKEHKIDCIIGVFREFDDVKAAIIFKKKYPSVKAGAYYLDILKGVKPEFVPEFFFEYIATNGEFRYFNELDFILMTEGGKNVYTRKPFNKFKDKIQFVDLPVFRNLNAKYENPLIFSKEIINIVYAGTLNSEYRNPEYFLRVISEVYKTNKKIKLHLFGSHNCGDLIEIYEKSFPGLLIDYGVVDSNKAQSALLSADVLLNISNKIKMVPSKIFELFSTGKPIINVVNDRADISLKYFDKYPSVFYIYEDEPLMNSINKLCTIFSSSLPVDLEFNELKNKFIENTPKHSCDIIEMQLKKTEL